MNPSEYYKTEIMAKVREPELRKVASVMADHVGEENAITLEQLCVKTGMGDRQTRLALEVLTKDYGVPIGSYSGKSGRWIIADELEKGKVIAELISRATALHERANALRRAQLPSGEARQEYLFEPPKPQPWQLQYGEWR